MKNNQKTCLEIIEGYVIGVDGGGTKTVAALADLNGKILKIGKAGSASPRNVGIKKAVENVTKAISQVLKGKKNIKIVSIFIGLPAVAEEFKFKIGEIKKELLKQKEISKIFQSKIMLGSDQIVAFRSGTDNKEGVLLIAGTGCVVHGWRKGKEFKTSGWGWITDEGSAFGVGQEVLQAVFKDLDGRGPKTLLTKKVFQEFRIRKMEDLINLVYSKNPTGIIPRFSILCDEASKKRDKIAKNIMTEAGRELALSANTVIKKLNFQNKRFPLVLIGGIFKSKIILDIVKKEIKKMAPKVEFIQPRVEPVVGAIKLAIENL